MKLVIHEHYWCIKKSREFQLWLKYNDYKGWQDLPERLPHFGGFYAGCWWNISKLLDVYCRTAIVIHIDVIHILGIFQEHLNFVGMQGELTDEWSSVFLERHVHVGNLFSFLTRITLYVIHVVEYYPFFFCHHVCLNGRVFPWIYMEQYNIQCVASCRDTDFFSFDNHN